MTGGAGENGPLRGDSGEQGTELDIGLPCGSAGEESTCHVGDLCSIPGVKKNFFCQYSCLGRNIKRSPLGGKKNLKFFRDKENNICQKLQST